MSDDLKNRGPADRSRISLGEDWERRYWRKKFSCSASELGLAIAAVGHRAAAVQVYLEANAAVVRFIRAGDYPKVLPEAWPDHL